MISRLRPEAAEPFVGCLCYLPALKQRSRHMSETYIIEVASQPAGIVVRNDEGYRFFAASHRFNRMEGQVFRNAREAERLGTQTQPHPRDAPRRHTGNSQPAP